MFMKKSMIQSPLWSRILIASSIFGLTACQTFSDKQQPSSQDNSALINSELLAESDDTLLVDAVPSENLWDAVVSGYGLPSVDHSKIANHLRWYSNNQRYLDRVVDQGEPYLHYIKKELKENDLPLEFILLPIIESAYNPLANSSARAAGIWQFIPGTGRAFGLAQNHWFDGRRDLVASTDAAITYLKRLHNMFDGDWLLAIAAYNAGEGTVSRAVRRNKQANKPTDFWSLKLPKQTQAYVPQLLALAEVVKNPAKYDVAIKSVPNQPYFAQINVNKPIDIAVAARMADMDPHHLRRLNAGHIQWVANTKGNYRILVPLDNVDSFKEVLSEIPSAKPVSIGGTYTVKSGDTLGAIAKRHQTTVAEIQRANRLSSTLVRIGQKLAIPGQQAVASSVGAEVDKSMASNNYQVTEYKVKSGDNLWTIAKKHKITLATLLDYNNLTAKSKIKPGQTLIVKETKNVSVVDGKIVYQIQKGDTLNKIATKFSVPKQKIIAWNKVKDESYIHPGQELLIFVNQAQ